MHRNYLKSIVTKHCYRSNGQLNAAWINKKHWDKHGLSDEYQMLMSLCDHPDAKLAQIVYHLNNDLPALYFCKNQNCDQLRQWSKNTSSYNAYCSKQCAASCENRIEVWRQTNFNKYGQGNYGQTTQQGLEKKRQTCVKNYGVDSFSKTANFKDLMSTKNPMHNSTTVRKQQDSIIEKFGTHHLNIPGILEKRRETTRNIYGVDHHMANAEVQQKFVSSLRQNHGDHVSNSKHIHLTAEAVDLLSDPARLEAEVSSLSIFDVAEKYQLHITTLYKYISRYQIEGIIRKTGSFPEQAVCKLIEKIDPNVTLIRGNRSLLGGKEIDILLPEHNLAIEINGIYWHSDLFKHKEYHFEKWRQCKDLGLRYLCYTDADVLYRSHVIENKLKYCLGKITQVIGARQITIGQVNYAQEAELLRQYHIQGELKTRSGSIGAFHQGKLVAAMVWLKKPSCTEITRFCCDCQASYPGLFSKMLKHSGIIGKVISFSNNDHSDGGLYRSAGFQLEEVIGPAYWYTKDFTILENRQRYMKSKIAKKFSVETHNKTEKQLMQELGYRRYYDSGKQKWGIMI